jgi:hypothetical protein
LQLGAAGARADDTGCRYTGERKGPKERVRMTCMRSCAITERSGTGLLLVLVRLSVEEGVSVV